MMADKSATRFGLIRHAETFWNRERRVQGQLDSPLTPDGQQQADQWGRTLKPLPWDGIQASDTGRAVATAAIMHVHLNLAIETAPHEGVIKALAQPLCGTGYTPSDSVRIKGHHLHWLSAADGKLALAGLNAMARNA